MASVSRFVIENDSLVALVLNVEPEGAFFPLDRGRKVFVVDASETLPVTLRFSRGEHGESILSIWPGDGDVRVEKDGVNLLDTL